MDNYSEYIDDMCDDNWGLNSEKTLNLVFDDMPYSGQQMDRFLMAIVNSKRRGLNLEVHLLAPYIGSKAMNLFDSKVRYYTLVLPKPIIKIKYSKLDNHFGYSAVKQRPILVAFEFKIADNVSTIQSCYMYGFVPGLETIKQINKFNAMPLLGYENQDGATSVYKDEEKKKIINRYYFSPFDLNKEVSEREIYVSTPQDVYGLLPVSVPTFYKDIKYTYREVEITYKGSVFYQMDCIDKQKNSN